MGPGVPGNIFEYNSPITAKIQQQEVNKYASACLKYTNT